MAYKDEDVQSLDDLQVPHSLETFINHLPNRYENGEIDTEVEKQMEKDWWTFNHRVKKERTILKNRFVTIPVAVAAACCLFIGAAFISPSVANIAAAFPYLNLVFEEKIDAKPLISDINKAIREQDFQLQDIVVSVDNTTREVTVMVLGSEEYFNEVRAPIKSLIEDLLKAKNHESFKVNMLNDPETARIFKEMMENPSAEEVELEKVSTIVGDVLENYGYDKGGVGVRKGRIDLENIPNTEIKVEEIKANIIEELRNAGMGEYEVKVHLFDEKASERVSKFMPIYHTITDGLMAKPEYYKIDSVGSSSKKDYFYIEVRTTIPSTDPNIDEVVNTLEVTILEFLQSPDIQKQIQNEPYKVTIESTDKKELKVIQN
jgi:hypothetical protein